MKKRITERLADRQARITDDRFIIRMIISGMKYANSGKFSETPGLQFYLYKYHNRVLLYPPPSKKFIVLITSLYCFQLLILNINNLVNIYRLSIIASRHINVLRLKISRGVVE